MIMSNELTIETTSIPGLYIVHLPVHGDNRGWFKENWQREKMVALGLPDFQPIQNNMSFNEVVGTTRGIHAEPWDKLISVATGKIFGAWVDLREGDSFGQVFSVELGPEKAVFVPRGVGNAYQTLEPNTAYSYLVNAHWSPDATYTFLNLADETSAVPWPIPLDEAELSDKDRNHPRLDAVAPIKAKKTLILGAYGQLGRALIELFPDAEAWDRDVFDMSDPAAYGDINWDEYATVINAAAYTKVDEAETMQGRREAWQHNVHAVVELVKVARKHDLTFIHVSSDYVFDGVEEVHATDELFSPLSVYGQTKAAGDAVVQTLDKYYIARTSWVVGDGPNFIATMQRLAENGVDPQVIDDQFGEITYTTDLAREIKKLIDDESPFGTYNVTSRGGVKSWFEVAREAFKAAGYDPERVIPVSTEEYGADKELAPRPRNSALQ